jgi:hypothetical protein
MKGQGAIAYLILLLLFLCALVAAFQIITGTAVTTNEGGVQIGNPEQFARATGVARSADLAREATAQALTYGATQEAANSLATATSAAVQMQATGTALAGNAIATATAQAQIANATETAVPWQAPQVANQAQTAMVNRWTGTAALGAELFVAFFMGLAFVLMVRTRARMIPRDASGQLPGVLIGRTLTDPQRQIGPAVTMPQDPGLLWNLARMVRYVRTGDVLPLPAPQVQVTDGGATADHLLEAARQAAQVATAAAVFRPGDPEARKEKIELILKRDGGRLLGAGRMPEVKLIDDPQKVDEFRKTFELESGE